jgi:hypothetical protein
VKKQVLTVALVKFVLAVLDRMGPTEGHRATGDALDAEAVEELVTVGNSPESP